MYCDYHTHTPLCLHASGTPQEYVQAAIRAGLREYGISDHAPMPGEPFDDWRMKQADMPAYLDWLTEARECAALHLSLIHILVTVIPQGKEALNQELFILTEKIPYPIMLRG